MENDPSKQPGRGCIMSADQVYSQHEEFFRNYDETAEALHHNEQLIQQQREERKMAWEPMDNYISIFKNKYKTEAKHPYLTGKGLVGGVQYKVAAWKKVSEETGETFLNLKFELPKDKGSSYSKPQPEPTTDEDFPF